MHLLLPYAGPSLSDAGRSALAKLALPNLARLLARLETGALDAGDERSLSPPHERALAHALGIEGEDGALPWAAHFAAIDGVDVGGRAWGLLSPTHWHVGAELVSLTDPDTLDLDQVQSRALLGAVAPLFESDGFALAWGAPARWYIAHPTLAALPTASLDRVIGRNVDGWLPSGAAARALRRLQSEVQMLLHTHPVNAEREARGQLPVNSFWLSGCGVHQRARDPSVVVLDALRGPALAEDWATWRERWRALDVGPIGGALRAHEALTLTLAGERSAQRFESRVGGWWSRLASHWRGVDVVSTLEAL